MQNCLELSNQKITAIQIQNFLNHLISNNQLIFNIKEIILAQSVNLQFNELNDEGINALCSVIKSYNLSLTSLDLGFNHIKDEGIKTLALTFSSNSTIKILGLSGNIITSTGFSYLKQLLIKNNVLESLFLTGNSGKEEGAMLLAEGLLCNTALQKLFVNGNGIQTEGCIAIANVLSINHTIKYLNMSDNNIRDEGFLAISNALFQHRHLEDLELSFNSITHNCMTLFANALIGYTSMKKLCLDNNKLKDAGAKSLALALPTLHLIELNLGFNEINNDGLIDVITAIENSNHLKVLVLSGNTINNHVAKCMAKYLLQNIVLTSLFLDHTNIGPVGEKYIAAGVATNRSSGLLHLTGIELGKTLTLLGSPKHIATFSNEVTLRYLFQMWAAHKNLQDQTSSGPFSDQPSDLAMSENLEYNQEFHIRSHEQFQSPPRNSLSNISRVINGTTGSRPEHENENKQFIVYPNNGSNGLIKGGPSAVHSSTNIGSSPSTSSVGTASLPLYSDSTGTSQLLRTKRSDLQSFPFLSQISSTKSQNNLVDVNHVDIVVARSAENILLSTSHSSESVQLHAMKICSTDNDITDEKDVEVLVHESIPNGVPNDVAGDSTQLKVRNPAKVSRPHSDEVTKQDFRSKKNRSEQSLLIRAARELAKVEFRAAELWELHQYYFSPPQKQPNDPNGFTRLNGHNNYLEISPRLQVYSSDRSSSKSSIESILVSPSIGYNQMHKNGEHEDNDDEEAEDVVSPIERVRKVGQSRSPRDGTFDVLTPRNGYISVSIAPTNGVSLHKMRESTPHHLSKGILNGNANLPDHLSTNGDIPNHRSLNNSNNKNYNNIVNGVTRTLLDTENNIIIKPIHYTPNEIASILNPIIPPLVLASSTITTTSTTILTTRAKKRRMYRKTLDRIEYFPKIKAYLEQLKTKSDEYNMLVILRQLRFLEHNMEDFYDCDVENLLLHDIIDQVS